MCICVQIKRPALRYNVLQYYDPIASAPFTKSPSCIVDQRTCGTTVYKNWARARVQSLRKKGDLTLSAHFSPFARESRIGAKNLTIVSPGPQLHHKQPRVMRPRQWGERAEVL
jgi:hypothetical protein